MLKQAKLSSICQNTRVTEEISFSWRAKAALEITRLTILPLHILPSNYLALVKVKAILNGKPTVFSHCIFMSQAQGLMIKIKIWR